MLANVSNNVGLVPGALSGIYGYRAELAGQRARVLRLGSASVLGGLVGAILLLVLPQSAFKAIVPALIAIALVMVVVQPWLSKKVAARQAGRRRPGGPMSWRAPARPRRTPMSWREHRRARHPPRAGRSRGQSCSCLGVAGGYSGAAQGILLLGLLGIMFTDDLQRINAVKNVLACVVNAVAAVVFILATHIDWTVAALIAAGSIIGGQIGARGRRLPPGDCAPSSSASASSPWYGSSPSRPGDGRKKPT